MNLVEKLKLVKAIFPQATLWGMNEDGPIDLLNLQRQ